MRGKIKQVIAAWPFMTMGPQWTAAELIENARTLGLNGVELLPVEDWSLLSSYEMVCAATKSHSFIRGMNNLNHHPECFAALEAAMEASARAGFPNVMTFTGLGDTSMEKNGSRVSPEEGMRNCIKGYKSMAILAERHNVTMILEPLNSKVTEPRKGHADYQGDHIEYCMEIIKAVSSPGLKLLFDVYHIQIMDGDIISHIDKYSEYIAHVQIAGVPGRGEIGERQEINYRAVMRALLANNYDGYVGHEWIPTADAMAGLQEAVEICDV